VKIIKVVLKHNKTSETATTMSITIQISYKTTYYHIISLATVRPSRLS